MPAPFSRAARGAAKRRFLSTRGGAVALSVFVVVAGSLVLVAAKSLTPPVGGLERDVDRGPLLCT